MQVPPVNTTASVGIVVVGTIVGAAVGGNSSDVGTAVGGSYSGTSSV